jgi:uncharacterized membrane protein
MALQIRRGTNNERLLMNGIANPVPAQGELLYVTDRKKLFIGDGSTTGGTSAGYFGAIAVSGQTTLFSSGTNESLTIVAGDNISITTNENTNAITINAAAQFDEINNGSIRLLQNNIVGLNSNENINIDPAGTGKVVITGALDVSGTISGNLTGNVTGTVSGNAGTVTNGVYTTDVGSVTSIMLAGNISNSKLLNSSITVGTTGINLGASSATLAGLTSVTSTSFTGNIFTNLIDSADSSEIIVTPTTRFNSDVTFDERVYADRFFGNVTGNIVGNVVGDVVGNITGNVVGDVVGNVSGADFIRNKNIQLNGNTITTTLTNENLVLNPNGSGRVDINANILTNGLQIFGPGTGGDSGDGSVFVATSSSSAIPLSVAGIHNSATLTGGVAFSRARGNLLAQTIVQNGDEIQALAFNGYDGANFIPAATIEGFVAGTPSTGIVPGRLSLTTADAAGVLASRFDIESTKVTSAVPFKLVSFADATARDAYFTGLSISPEAGMMVFLTGTSKFSGYNGAAWNDLN